MDILELILSRRSYRGPYEDAPVPREDLQKIMESGLAAPSGCNKQTTSLIAVDDPELLSRLKGAIDPPLCLPGRYAPTGTSALTCRTTRRR
jgi:nitroreductase